MNKTKILIFIEWVYPSNEKNFISLYRELKKYFESVHVAVFSYNMYKEKKLVFQV